MSVVAVDFAKSRRAEEQRYIRRVIRRIHRDKLTKSQRDVLMVLVNTWFYHEAGPRGYIHLGTSKIAKKAGCAQITVKRALTVFRDLGIIRAVAYLKGGTGKATQYRVATFRILELYDPHGVAEREGQLVPIKRPIFGQNDTVWTPGNDTVYGCQNDTLSIRAYNHDARAMGGSDE